MKLTPEQIEYIDSTLVLNGLEFEDIKLEVTDHIASEVEVLMEENTLSFEENLHVVIDRWKPQLRHSFSGLIGFTNPKIMTVKCNKMIKKQFFIVIGSSALMTLLLLAIFRNSNHEAILTNFQLVLKSLCMAEFCLVILAWGFIWKSKHKTTYGYLIKKKTFGIIIFLFMIGIGVFPLRLNHLDVKTAFVSHFFAIAYVLIAGFYLQLANKHFQFEKKIAISKQ